MSDQLLPKGTERVLMAYDPIVLDDPDSVYYIVEGSVGVFAVPLVDGVPEGRRRHLFNRGPDHVMFCVAPREEGAEHQVVASPLSETRVIQVSQADWRAYLVEGGHAQAMDAIGEWLVLWEGVDDPENEEDRGASAFLNRLAEWDHAEAKQSILRLQEREEKSKELTNAAFTDLASVLTTKKYSPPVGKGDPHFRAAHAVGAKMGIEVKPTATSEDLSRVKSPIEAIARASGFRTRKVLLRGEWWTQDCGPLLGHLEEEDRPVALIPIAPGRYQLYEPQSGGRLEITKERAAALSPEAHMFYRPFPAKALKSFDVVKFGLQGRGRDVGLLIAVSISATLLGMVVPHGTSLIMDDAVPGADKSLLLQVGLALLFAAFGQGLFQLSQGIVTLRLQTATDTVTQSAVWDRLLGLKTGFFREYSAGDLQMRVMAISQIRDQLTGTTMRSLLSSTMGLLNLLLLWYYSTTLMYVALGSALLLAVITMGSGWLILRYQRELLKLMGEVYGATVQLVNGVTKLRVAAAEERAFAFWARGYSKQQSLIVRSQRINDLVAVVNTLVWTGSTGVLFYFAVDLLQNPQGAKPLTTGTFLAFLSAFGTFMGGVSSLSNTLTDLLNVKVLQERADPILRAIPEVDAEKTDPGPLKGGVELDRLVFSYTPNGPVTLNDVTLKASPGEMIALVGPSGSGKSTIVRLLLGFETADSGKVMVDGQDMSGLDVSAVRRQLGVVLQGGRISAESLFDSISGGSVITLDEAWASARAAGFDQDIQDMPMGMHTMISEGGTNLSGGQRQRLLIARALVLKPKILIFDEATSALDNRTQAIVSKSLEDLHVTRIVIAHRLSTIRNADRIFVLEAGRLVQEGSYDELAEQEGLFKRLIKRQVV